jgi:hypothetical protein
VKIFITTILVIFLLVFKVSFLEAFGKYAGGNFLPNDEKKYIHFMVATFFLTLFFLFCLVVMYL